VVDLRIAPRHAGAYLVVPGGVDVMDGRHPQPGRLDALAQAL
jgi:hypothetical protein